MLDLLNNPTKFQLTWIRTQDFQLKLIDIAVNLKYGQDHRKWYEQVKLSEWYHQAKFDFNDMHGS